MVVWRRRPFTKCRAGEGVWNHAIHRVVILEFHYYKPLCFLVMITSLPPHGQNQLAKLPHHCVVSEAYQHQLASRPAGAIMIFTRSRNATTGDNSIYCMIPNPFPSTVFGKGSATPTTLVGETTCANPT